MATQQAWAGACPSCERCVWVTPVCTCEMCGSAVPQDTLYLAQRDAVVVNSSHSSAAVHTRNARLLLWLGVVWIVFWFAAAWYRSLGDGGTLLNTSPATVFGALFDVITNLKAWPGFIMVFMGIRGLRQAG